MIKKYRDDNTFLGRWLNNDLTKEELKDFQDSEDYKTLSKIAERSTEFGIPTFDQNHVKTKIQQSIYHSKTKVISIYYKIAIAASIAILCSIVGMNYLNTSTTTFTSNLGESIAFTLPDGSIVELNGKSTITFVKKDWKNNKRKLHLQGEGLFKVKKGSKFTVESNEGNVSVLGTQFNVKTFNNFYAVECYEGKVEVEKNNNKTILSSGKGFQYKNRKQHNLILKNPNPNWKSKNYTYNKMPLSIVFNDLQNIYNIANLKLTKTDLSMEFTGKLVVDDLKKALDIICKPMNLKYAISKNSITITSL